MAQITILVYVHDGTDYIMLIYLILFGANYQNKFLDEAQMIYIFIFGGFFLAQITYALLPITAISND